MFKVVEFVEPMIDLLVNVILISYVLVQWLLLQLLFICIAQFVQVDGRPIDCLIFIATILFR